MDILRHYNTIAFKFSKSFSFHKYLIFFCHREGKNYVYYLSKFSEDFENNIGYFGERASLPTWWEGGAWEMGE